MPDADYYIRSGDTVTGPFSRETIRGRLGSGSLGLGDEIARVPAGTQPTDADFRPALDGHRVDDSQPGTEAPPNAPVVDLSSPGLGYRTLGVTVLAVGFFLAIQGSSLPVAGIRTEFSSHLFFSAMLQWLVCAGLLFGVGRIVDLLARRDPG